jgi:hypothetical protein
MTLLIPDAFHEANLPLATIYRHPDLQVRMLQPFGNVHVQQDVVSNYRQLIEEDNDLGSLSIVEEVGNDEQLTGRMLLADGYHRFEAMKQLGHESAPCKIYRGSWFTAILLAARENGGRGLQFSLSDRKKVAEQILIGLAKQGVRWSDREIANWAGLDRATVAKVREELQQRRDVGIPDEIEVHGSDGRVYTITPPTPRPRWNPYQEYQFDELLDNLPNADKYTPPPEPRKPSRGDWRKTNPDYPQLQKQPSRKAGDGGGAKPWTPSKDFGRIEYPANSKGAASGAWQPVQRVARTISYDLTYRRASEQGVEEAEATEKTIRLLPRDVLAQVLWDSGIMDVLEQLPAELLDKVLRDLRL